MIARPTFVMSLDLELLWGLTHDDDTTSKKRHIEALTDDPQKGRGAVDRILHLFEKYNIPATWAVVGHLFLADCDRRDGIPHRGMPRFRADWYSCDPMTDIKQDPLYYGRDIVEKIRSSPVPHEIGYHSFSHVTFSKCSREVAEAEVKEGLRLATELGMSLRSFVFPNNGVGHVDILREHGFVIYRGPNLAGRNLNKRLVTRTVNFTLGKMMAPPVEPVWQKGIWEIPSSMIFCDHRFPFTLVFRAKMGINKAVREKKVFHVFLHPEDLVADPALADRLDELLAFAARQRDQGKLQAMTMGEIASCLPEKGW